MGWFLAPELIATGLVAPEGALLVGGASGLSAGAGISGVTGVATAASAGSFLSDLVPSTFGGTGGKVGIGDAFAGIGALSSFRGGQIGQQGAEFEAAQFREEQENARVAAMQEEVQRRRQLTRTLSSINAIRAGRGVELFAGGSEEAIKKQTILEAEEDINTANINALNRARRFGLSAEQSRLRGQAELLGGVGGAATALSRGFTRT